MNSHDVLRDVFERVNVKSVAAGMGIKPPTVYKWAQPATPGDSGVINPLDRIKKLLDCTEKDTAIVQWICSEAGGYFTENPQIRIGTPSALLPKASKAMDKCSKLLGVISQVIEDGKVTHEESVRLRAEWEKTKSIMESFVMSCEGGEFKQP